MSLLHRGSRHDLYVMPESPRPDNTMTKPTSHVVPELTAWRERHPGRLPDAHLETRINKESRKAARLGVADLNTPPAPTLIATTIRLALALTGLRQRAVDNACRIEMNIEEWHLKNLSTDFDGFRLLQISDPHFGADPAIDDAIIEQLGGIEHDLCVLTGDYRYRSAGPSTAALDGLRRLREVVEGDILALLGNHDSINTLPAIEAMGIDVLLNESRTLRRGDAALHFVGVDDPNFFRTDDLPRALEHRDLCESEHAATVCLAHAPELAEEAAQHGCDLFLTGHTHGGQICLPGRIPILRNSRAPYARLSGRWQVQTMQGYTSRGCGVSVAPARFFCPPEITIHVLRSSSAPS